MIDIHFLIKKFVIGNFELRDKPKEKRKKKTMDKITTKGV